jgi:hypothetical protein
MSLSRQELHELAEAGARAMVQDMERRLADLYKEWPGLFVSKTPPQLLAPALKAAGSNGNGHWPAVLRVPHHDPQDRDQRLLAFVARHPDGVKPKIVNEFLHEGMAATSSAMHRLVKRGLLRRPSNGVFASPTSAPPPPKPRKRVKWTPAMRKAAAARMRARWKDPKAAKHLAASLEKARARA